MNNPKFSKESFIEACEKLTKLYPDLFRIGPSGFGWFANESAKLAYLVDFDIINSDDIDQILAKIGWEFEVKRGFGSIDWAAVAWKIVEKEDKNTIWCGLLKTKLDAAKAALIAVAEQEFENQYGTDPGSKSTDR
jgi:hypothetical protein